MTTTMSTMIMIIVGVEVKAIVDFIKVFLKY
jgi:hypothetical protein